MHFRDKASGQCIEILTILVGAGDNLVINIGNITNIGHMLFAINRAQMTINNIEHHQHPRVANMAHVIHGHAAHIQTHIFDIDGFENFFLLT